MGLDAVVFKSVSRMRKEFGDKKFAVDPDTGEATPDAASGLQISLDSATALSRRLGNIAQIEVLRTAAAKALRGEALVLKQILYSGAHSGDAIAQKDFPRLKTELDALAARKIPELDGFIEDMRALLAAAEIENNPIAFV